MPQFCAGRVGEWACPGRLAVVDRLIAVTAAAIVVLAGCGRPETAPSGEALTAVAALAARNLFAKDKGCPVERVTATEAQRREPQDAAWPPTPELKIMAYARFMVAEGCGSTAVYACMTRSGPGEVPYCVAPGPAP